MPWSCRDHRTCPLPRVTSLLVANGEQTLSHDTQQGETVITGYKGPLKVKCCINNQQLKQHKQPIGAIFDEMTEVHMCSIKNVNQQTSTQIMSDLL